MALAADYSKYREWQKVTTPSGGVYYKVPGTRFVYDPFLSAARGRPVLGPDPTLSIKEKEDAKKAIEQQNSLSNQLIPVLAGTAGTLAGAWGISQIGKGATPAPVVTPPVTPVAQTIAGGAGTTAHIPVATAADGSTIMGIPLFNGGQGGDQLATQAAPGILSQAPGTTVLGSEMAGALLPAAGLAAGAYTGYQQLKGLQSAYKGKDLLFQQQAALALPTFGASFLYNPIKNKFFQQDKWKTEGNRLNALAESGTYIPEGVMSNIAQGPQSKEDLVKKAQESGGNVVFAQTRNESTLTPADILGYATFAEKDPNWFKKSLQEQTQVAQQALDAGAVREHHGTVDVDWSKVPQVDPNVELIPEVSKTPSKDIQMGIKLANRFNSGNNKAKKK